MEYIENREAALLRGGLIDVTGLAKRAGIVLRQAAVTEALQSKVTEAGLQMVLGSLGQALLGRIKSKFINPSELLYVSGEVTVKAICGPDEKGASVFTFALAEENAPV